MTLDELIDVNLHMRPFGAFGYLLTLEPFLPNAGNNGLVAQIPLCDARSEKTTREHQALVRQALRLLIQQAILFYLIGDLQDPSLPEPCHAESVEDPGPSPPPGPTPGTNGCHPH